MLNDIYREKIKNCGIYILTNKINNKVYVGQSVDIKHRLYRHKKRKTSQLFGRAIQKYGFDNFDIKIINCRREMLNTYEKRIY